MTTSAYAIEGIDMTRRFGASPPSTGCRSPSRMARSAA